jgi:Second Messenger Oligonucleotide or Dinucleotide Synthetase domain
MATVSERFLKLKENLEPSATLRDLIGQRHNAVRDFIQNRNSKVTDTKLIGSVRRQTRIAPRPEDKVDIDILIIMGSFYSWLPPGAPGGITPQLALDDLHRTVTQSDRYGSMTPQQAPPTITMTYADRMNVEVVPAYLDCIGTSANGTPHRPAGRAYWVPKNGTWELADYDYEAGYISAQNDASGGWLIPTIKMLKAIRRNYFPRMKSFHLDIMATVLIPISVGTKRQYNLPISFPALIKDFFDSGSQYVSAFTKIPGSHSPVLVVPQAEINALVDTFNKIKDYIDAFSKLPETQQIEGWKALFGEPFPST